MGNLQADPDEAPTPACSQQTHGANPADVYNGRRPTCRLLPRNSAITLSAHRTVTS